MSEGIEPGVKNDGEKPRWDLLPYREVGEIVDVLSFGMKKYSPDNWKRVPEPRRRYFAAMMRHMTAWWDGESHDPETNKSHLAHAGACLLFLMWHDKERTCSPEK